jgi:hypothetical protein
LRLNDDFYATKGVQERALNPLWEPKMPTCVSKYQILHPPSARRLLSGPSQRDHRVIGVHGHNPVADKSSGLPGMWPDEGIEEYRDII